MKKNPFLQWCVKLANYDLTNAENVQSLAEAGIKNGFLIDHAETAKWIVGEKDGPALQQNVRAFATVMNHKVNFVVDIQKKDSIQQLHIYESEGWMPPESYSGSVRFRFVELIRVPQVKQDAEKKRFKEIAEKMNYSESWITTQFIRWMDDQQRVADVPEDLPLNNLVGRFYKAVHQHVRDNKCGFKDFPFRICKNCGKVFFGRLKAQRFCRKRCGEIFHAKLSKARVLKATVKVTNEKKERR